MLIVVAWVEEAHVWDGEPYRSDLGHNPTFIKQRVPRACVWASNGCEAELRRATDFVEKEYPTNGIVVTYEDAEEDPLGCAKYEVMRLVQPPALEE